MTENYIKGGFVLLARAISGSSLMSTPPKTFKLAIYILAQARYEDYKWFCPIRNHDIIIKRGELTDTIGKMAQATKLSYKEVRTALKHLFGHGFCSDITPIEVKRAKGYFHISINKYDTYQNMSNYEGIRRANDGQTMGKRRATIKGIKRNLKEFKELSHKDIVTGIIHDAITKKEKELTK